MMHRFHSAGRAARRPIISTLLALGAAALIGASRPATAQVARAPAAAAEEAEVPHAFFTHMGLPEGVGNFNLRVLGIATRAGGQTDGDFAFHLETGLTPNIGFHLRNDRFLNNDKTEAMFQYTAFVSKDGMSGFAPIIEFAERGWRRTVSAAVAAGIPVPAMSAALAYFDSYRRERLPQNLTQAQRDFFGSHTYQRTDRPAAGFVHTEWQELAAKLPGL